MDKPLCGVHGMIHPGAVCGSVIVGMKYCGHKGECEFKIDPNVEEPQVAEPKGNVIKLGDNHGI